MSPEDLAEVAKWLADDSKTGRARQAFRRRAVSTAYYAVFHAIARLCADELVGATAERAIVYRALDHGAAKNGLRTLAAMSGNSAILRTAIIFADLQKARHEADYSEGRVFTAQEALNWRNLATDAISELGRLPSDLRKALAVRILFKVRSDRP